MKSCAVVAGASSGIGAATAIAFARRGIDVVAAARHPERLLEPARSAGVERRLDLVSADLTQAEGVEKVFARAETNHPPVRYVVHSVGYEYRVGWYREASAGEVAQAISSLISSPALILHRALRSMAPGGGNIGLMSSGAAGRPTPGRSLYSASKIALNRLVESVGAECAATSPGTAVFGIVPGRVDTPAQRRLIQAAEDADPTFGLDRFRSVDEVWPAHAVGTAIASLTLSKAADLNGQLFRYSPDGWKALLG